MFQKDHPTGLLAGGASAPSILIFHGIQKEKDIREDVLFLLEQLMGVEPTYAAWEAAVLPMNYSCIWKSRIIIPDLFPFCKLKIVGCMKPPHRT